MDIEELLKVGKKHYGTMEALYEDIGISRQYVGRVRRGEVPVPPYMAARLTELAGGDGQAAAIEALAAQAKKPEQRAFWKRIGATVAAASFAAVLFTENVRG